MPAGWNDMVITAALDNVRHGSTIDLQVGRKIPAKVRRSDDNETTFWASGGVGNRDRRKEDKNQKKSADVAG